MRLRDPVCVCAQVAYPLPYNFPQAVDATEQLPLSKLTGWLSSNKPRGKAGVPAALAHNNHDWIQHRDSVFV